MSETCKICGRDTATDKTYQEIRETENAESYLVCKNCYPLNCPKCGVEMEAFDLGADYESDWRGEYLNCEKCKLSFSVSIHVRKWWFWWKQYIRDMGKEEEFRKKERAEFLEQVKKWRKEYRKRVYGLTTEELLDKYIEIIGPDASEYKNPEVREEVLREELKRRGITDEEISRRITEAYSDIAGADMG